MASTSSPLPAGEPSESRVVRRTIAGLSLFVVVAVWAAMRLGGGSHPVGLPVPSALAQLNVVLNASCAVLLTAGFVLIRRGQRQAHRLAMLLAFGLSCLFLVSYLLHHAQAGSIPFQGTGLVRTVYFTLLIPHVVLAAGIVPLALLTLYRGQTGRWAAHRAIARWTLPLWLFVSVSGVAVYWLLYHGISARGV
jgi:putative membrane protein